MDKFWVVTAFHLGGATGEREQLERLALEEFNASGIEEFSMSEAEVDALLGERSYSGGDLPQELIDEVEAEMSQRPGNLRFYFTQASEAQGFYSALKKSVLGELQIEECESKDWNAEWKKHYSAIKVTEKFTIVPAWEKGKLTVAPQQLYINPGMGFGTGSHETTFLCLKLYLESVTGQAQQVLDFGSGSGILGLAALMLRPGAQVDFYDIDPEANKNCYENAKLNELTERSFRLLLPSHRRLLQPSYDLIFANILENVLMSESEFLTSRLRSEGELILSGLLKHQASGIIERYCESGLKLIQQHTRGDWSALLFRKTGP